MGILIGILAVALNLAFRSLLLSIEKRLAAKGKIFPRGKILYLGDYNFFKYGNKWFLSAMDFAIAFVLVERWPLPWLIAVLCLLAGIAWTALWHRVYLGRKKAFDSAYPMPRTVSLLGRIHLGYFWAQYVLGFMGLGMVVLMALGQRPWSPAAFLGIAAGLGYFATLLSDYVAGRAP